MRRVLSAVIAALAVSGACSLRAAPVAPPRWGPTEKEVPGLIAQLGSAEFDRREKASEVLFRAGPAVWPALREARERTTDPETRRRLGRILGLEDAGSLHQLEQSLTAVIEHFVERCITEPRPEPMMRAAVRGLYQYARQEIPPPLVEMMKSRRWTEQQQRDVLRWTVLWLNSGHALDVQGTVRAAAMAAIKAADPYGELIDPEYRCALPRGEIRTADIGVRLASDGATGLLRVITPLPDSPARRAGLRLGDLIEQIILYPEEKEAGSPPRSLSTKGMTPEDATRQLTGDIETEVGVVVKRAGVRGLRTIRVQRNFTRSEFIRGWQRRADDSWDCWIDRAHGIAYIHLLRLARDTTGRIDEEIGRLHAEGLRGMILDLRGNPGGLLREAVRLGEAFVGEKPIIRVDGREGTCEIHLGSRAARHVFPLVCLIDRDTGSSAEIVAACLQDQGRAIIMGERSRGRCHIANVDDLDSSSWQMICTTCLLLRGDGRKLDSMYIAGRPADEWGVTPDQGFVLELPGREREELRQFFEDAEIIPDDVAEWRRIRSRFRDRQRDMALAYLREQIRRQSGG
jgi:carboxyl-terminal processing protease